VCRQRDDDASDNDELGLPWWADPDDDGECGDDA
jgi:hypothetical protein